MKNALKQCYSNNASFFINMVTSWYFSLICGALIFSLLWYHESNFPSDHPDSQLCDFNIPGQWVALVLCRGIFTLAIPMCLSLCFESEQTSRYAQHTRLMERLVAGGVAIVGTLAFMSLIHVLYINMILASYHPAGRVPPDVIDCPKSLGSQIGYNLAIAIVTPPLFLKTREAGIRFFKYMENIKDAGIAKQGVLVINTEVAKPNSSYSTFHKV